MKGLEYIQRQIYIVKQQIKGSNMKIMVTDAVTKQQYDYNENKLQTLESIEKSIKALEIIKKKTVDIWLIQNKKTLKQYNLLVDESRQLTKEEFNLLKEVLE